MRLTRTEARKLGVAIPKGVREKRPPSRLEEMLAEQMKRALPITRNTPVREHVFCPRRRWRFDFAWLWPIKLAVEVEGGTHSGGRHTRGTGFEDDCAKYAEALILGWRILRVTGKQVKSGQALAWIEKLLESAISS